ncbi:MAG: CbtA family protein, partial [Bdellovibrionia bacterium]
LRIIIMTRILVQGCKAGALAGVIWGLLMLGFVSPIIGQAEKYEDAAQEFEVHQHQHHHEHHHSTVSNVPDFEPSALQRPILTVLGTTLMGIAFGILMSVGLGLGMRFKLLPETLVRHPILMGAFFGLIGFLIFQGIPSLGLPPELPGIIGAENDYDARQTWWAFCVVCCGLGVISLVTLPVLLRNRMKRTYGSISFFIGAVALMLVPFIWGVPAHSELSVVPAELKTYFICVSTGVNALFWFCLGGLLFYFVYQTDRLIKGSTPKSLV